MLADRNFIQNSFYLNKDVNYFNTGNFGVCPRQVLEDKIRFIREIESNPVFSYCSTLFDSVVDNLKELALKIGGNSENMAFLPNVTQGINATLNSIEINQGDELLITTYTYGAVVMEAEKSFIKQGGIIRKLVLKPPFESADQIVNLYKNFVNDHPKIKYAIIDHIASCLPMVNPVEDIVKSLRSLGVFVIIDGAHVPGQIINFNVGNIDADVYIGSLNKWCFLPRGTAFIAVRQSCPFKIQPVVVSWLQNSGLNERFLYSGTQDFSNLLCVKSAFKFIDDIGGFDSIHSYNTQLLEKGIAFLESKWNVNSLKFPETAPFMRLIPYPQGFKKYKRGIAQMIAAPFERKYYNFTLNEFSFIATTILLEGELHFRLCCQIFMEFDDFVKLSEKVLLWLHKLDNNELSHGN